VSELHEKMRRFTPEGEIYSEKHFKDKLQEHYQDHIVFVASRGPVKISWVVRTWQILLSQRSGMITEKVIAQKNRIK
jgi:hypothetical protein